MEIKFQRLFILEVLQHCGSKYALLLVKLLTAASSRWVQNLLTAFLRNYGNSSILQVKLFKCCQWHNFHSAYFFLCEK